MWVLILVMTTGINSVNMESISGFTSERSCEIAGITATEGLDTRRALTKFVCVKQEG